MLETGLSPNRQIQRATWKGGKVMFFFLGGWGEPKMFSPQICVCSIGP